MNTDNNSEVRLPDMGDNHNNRKRKHEDNKQTNDMSIDMAHNSSEAPQCVTTTAVFVVQVYLFNPIKLWLSQRNNKDIQDNVITCLGKYPPRLELHV